MSFALKPCATEKSVFDKEVNITPLWLIRKQEAERKAKEETERTRLQQEAERKAKEETGMSEAQSQEAVQEII